MKTKHFIAIGLTCISGAAFSAYSTEPDQKVLTAALNKYLAQQGDFCLGKFDWPIDVSAPDFEMPTRNAVQMPVLEKLGLVVSTDVTVARKEDEAEETVPAKRYALTKAGKKFYQDKKLSSATSGGVMHHGDFCAGKLSLDKFVRWDASSAESGHEEIAVTYTYKFAAAKWTRDPDVQRVFPMVARILNGQSSMQLQQRFQLSGTSWVAVNPWEN